jgi:hypothetical protein
MNRAGLAFALGALAASSSAAAAKGGDWHDAPSAEARKTASQVTRCMVGAHDAEIAAALDAPFGGPETTVLLGPMITACFDNLMKPRMLTRPNLLRLPKLLLRGLLYEGMYARKFGKSAPASSFAMIAPAGYPAVAATATGSLARDYPALMRIGDCAVRSAPAQARALVLSEVAGNEEERALAAFEPAWSGCMPAGRQLTFSNEMIRASVAEPLYRLTDRAIPTREAGR